MAFKDPKKLRHKEVTAYKIVVDATVSIPKIKMKSIITNNVKPHFISLLPTSTRSVQGFRAPVSVGGKTHHHIKAFAWNSMTVSSNDEPKYQENETKRVLDIYWVLHMLSPPLLLHKVNQHQELCFKEDKLDSEMRNSLLKYLKQSFWLVSVAHLVINYRILKCFCTNSVWVLFSWKPLPCYPF